MTKTKKGFLRELLKGNAGLTDSFSSNKLEFLEGYIRWQLSERGLCK